MIFGWLHLRENDDVTKGLCKKKATAIAWEEMFKNGKNVFYRNGLLTGQVGIINAITHSGKMPYDCNIAMIGRGRVAKGAIKQLQNMGAEKISIYHSKNSNELKNKIGDYDVIVHCASSIEEILSENDLKNMKKYALLIHLGSDSIGGDFGAAPILEPFTKINDGNNLVYCVNHVPTIVYQTASKYISEDVWPYIDLLSEGKMDKTLKDAIVIKRGKWI
jgi:N5-(carboxyethyl)ornithine synthase